MRRLILVTGAAGYVGSHVVLRLLESDIDVVAVDNCINSVLIDGQHLPESLRRVEQLAQRRIKQFVYADLMNGKLLDSLFAKYSFDAVVHLAGLKLMAESVAKPLEYYRHNVSATVALLETMKKHNVFNLMFASSAAVYGRPKYLPIDESHPTGLSLTTPYAKSKFMVEQILQDTCAADEKWCAVCMRFFNVVGAHSSGEIGDDPPTVPKNLFPYVTQVAAGLRPEVKVFGFDFDTIDGTSVKDYIHIDDLTDAVLTILDKMLAEKWSRWYVFNLGGGRGHSILDIVKTFEEVTGKAIPVNKVERRACDVGMMWSNSDLARQILNWKPKRTIKEMCESSWKWQINNPKGYSK